MSTHQSVPAAVHRAVAGSDSLSKQVSVGNRAQTKGASFIRNIFEKDTGTLPVNRSQIFVISAILFFATFGARLLYWHSAHFDAEKVEWMATAGYRDVARLLGQSDIGSFVSPSSPLSSPNTISYQPGYALLMALFFRVFGESNSPIQVFQMLCDAASAVMIFLIAAELLPKAVAIIAGVLVALAPQFAWFAIVLLPDSMAALPILLAIYCLIRANKRPHLATVLAAGGFIGLSCWLRANGLLLAPFLAVLLVPILFQRGKRLGYAVTLVGSMILVIAPLTIRNAVVHGHFIPLSLRAGNTFIEGIADYDTDGKFGLPRTDLGVMKWEAEIYNRPDYYGNLFEPDGIKRERMRLARGLAVVRSHPVWFLSVMIRRAASMTRLARVNIISAQPPVTHSWNVTNEVQPIWSSSPRELVANAVIKSPGAGVSLIPGGEALSLTGDESNYGDQVAFPATTIQKNTDYVLTFPVKIEQGRMRVNLAGADRNSIYASTIIETTEGKTPAEQPLTLVQLPFVSGATGPVQLVFSNEASKPAHPMMQLSTIKLYALGPASHLWTSYPRALIRLGQKFFITAFMLPLAIVGAILMIQQRRYRALAILLAIPMYYWCVQSALHTEYRYVLTLHYFLFVLVSLTIYWISGQAWQRLRKIKLLQRLSRLSVS